MKRNKMPVTIVALLFGTVGTFTMFASHASTSTDSIDAASGTVSSCAAKVADTTANSGMAVKFGSGGSCSDPTTLDASGATMPDTNYAIPGGAIFMDDTGSDSNAGTQAAPVKTLNKAISLVSSGGTIVVRGGTYRDWYNNGSTYATINKQITIQAYPHEQVWFDGADVEPAGNWTSDGSGHWYMAWSTPSFCANGYYQYAYNAQPTSNGGPCAHYDVYADPSYPAASDPQMVFKNGAYLPEVTSLASVNSSNFYYQEDLANSTGRIYIGFNPSGNTVELAARPIALNMNIAGSQLLGIGVKRYATNEYTGNTTQAAVFMSGTGSKVENSVFTQMAGGALYLQATGGILNRTVLAGNGFTSLNSNGHQHSTGAADGLIIENSVINGNNAEHFGLNCSASCGSAGIKIAHMDGFTVKNNVFENNIGKAGGFWCDLACSGGVIVNNLLHDNGDDGLFYEVSDTGIIASNLVYNNGGYGIRVGSANTKIYNNTVVNNTGFGGIWVYDDSRSLGYGGWTDVGPDTVNVSVGNNIVEDTLNSNTILRAQAAWNGNTAQTNTQPTQFFDYFDYNAYYRTSSTQNLMRWIPYGSSETAYKSLATWQAAFGYDAHGTEASSGGDPFFISLTNDNYTVRSGSPAYQSGGALPADVAAALGVSTAAGQTRGALSWPGN